MIDGKSTEYRVVYGCMRDGVRGSAHAETYDSIDSARAAYSRAVAWQKSDYTAEELISKRDGTPLPALRYTVLSGPEGEIESMEYGHDELRTGAVAAVMRRWAGRAAAVVAIGVFFGVMCVYPFHFITVAGALAIMSPFFILASRLMR